MLYAILLSIIYKLAVSDNRRSGQNRNTNMTPTARIPMQRQMLGSSVSGNQISPFMVSNSINIPVNQIPVKKTFKGDGTDIWSEYIRYFENISELNGLDDDRKRNVFFTVLRGQAEFFCCGLSDTVYVYFIFDL